MNNHELIALIEKEWDMDDGFFGKLRHGHFDHEGFCRCGQVLGRIRQETGTGDTIPRRLVSLVWYIPLFMNWQTERVAGSVAVGEYERATNEIQTIVQEILGVP
jgi:hypothetical protein